MRTVLTSILTVDDLPWPELQALRLDGDVWALGTAMVPIDVDSTAELRAATLRPTVGERMVVELETAAWVWGARAFPPDRPQLCVRTSARTSRDPSSGSVVREVVMPDAAITVIAGIAVTTPLHTASEIARTVHEWMPAHAAIVASLAEIGSFDLAAVTRSMDRTRNLPNKRRAIDRISTACGELINPN